MTTVVHQPAAHPYVENLWGRRRGSRADGVGARRAGDGRRPARAPALRVRATHGRRPRGAGSARSSAPASPSSTPSTTSTTPTSSTQAEFHRSVAALVRAVDAVTTLTPAAARSSSARTGRGAGRHPTPARRTVRRHEGDAPPRDRARHLRPRRSGRPNLGVATDRTPRRADRRRPVMVHVAAQAPTATHDAWSGWLVPGACSSTCGHELRTPSSGRGSPPPSCSSCRTGGGHTRAPRGRPRPRHARARALVRRLRRPGCPHLR